MAFVSSSCLNELADRINVSLYFVYNIFANKTMICLICFYNFVFSDSQEISSAIERARNVPQHIALRKVIQNHSG